jgi:CheY-like chemotaxis protein
MAQVLALVPDLLFGSRLQGALSAAGEELELVGEEAQLRARLSERPVPAVLIVDLTDSTLGGAELVVSLREDGALARTRTMGFYAHVDTDVRAQAEQAGFDLVVPRSRMAREAAQLVAGLLERVG